MRIGPLPGTTCESARRPTGISSSAMRIEGVIFLADHLLETIRSFDEDVRCERETRVAGSASCGGNPALCTPRSGTSQARVSARPHLRQEERVGVPRRTSRPSRPMTRRIRSDGSTWNRFAHAGSRSECGEFVSCHRRESWIGTGRQDGDLPDGFAERPVAAEWPMQPRRSCPSRSSSVTKAPRRNAGAGTSGGSGGERPASAASMAPARGRAARRGRPASDRVRISDVLLSAADRVRAIELLVQHHARGSRRQGQRPRLQRLSARSNTSVGRPIGIAITT